MKPTIPLILVFIIFLSGCINDTVIPSAFSLNVSGNSNIHSKVSFINGTNVSMVQDTVNRTITISSSGGGGGIGDESDPVAMANISSNYVAWSLDTGGSVNATTCTGSPAQYSRYNGTGFDCYNDNSGSDDQTLAQVLTQDNTANMDINMAGYNVTNSSNLGVIISHIANVSNPHNITIAQLGNNYPNTSLINYLLINTYGIDFPNTNVTAANLLTWNNTQNSTYESQISASQGNDTADRLYVNNTFLSLAGGNMTGNLNMGNKTIVNSSSIILKANETKRLELIYYSNGSFLFQEI